MRANCSVPQLGDGGNYCDTFPSLLGVMMRNSLMFAEYPEPSSCVKSCKDYFNTI